MLTKAERDQLVLDHLKDTRYVANWTAKRYRYATLTAEDHYQNGLEGLIKAAEHFEPERGFKFWSMARRWVTGYIQKGIENQGGVVRVPRWRGYKENVRQQQNTLSLDESMGAVQGGDGAGDMTFLDVTCRHTPSYDDRLTMNAIDRCADKVLTDKQRAVFKLLAEDLTPTDIGRRLGCTHQAVHKNIQDGVARIRRRMLLDVTEPVSWQG